MQTKGKQRVGLRDYLRRGTAGGSRNQRGSGWEGTSQARSVSSPPLLASKDAYTNCVELLGSVLMGRGRGCVDHMGKD